MFPKPEGAAKKNRKGPLARGLQFLEEQLSDSQAGNQRFFFGIPQQKTPKSALKLSLEYTER